ncbi:MAG: hypothetical protein RL375_745 [Pseudomonadota bacterium]|jgi:hypothetical protein
MADIVDDFMQRLRAIAPDFPAQAAQQLEAQTRQVWGGTEPYVAKRPAQLRTLKIGEGLRAQKSLRDVFSDAGITKQHGYRLLSSKSR